MPLPTKFIIFVIFACFGQSKQLLATLSLIDKVVIFCFFLMMQKEIAGPAGKFSWSVLLLMSNT